MVRWLILLVFILLLISILVLIITAVLVLLIVVLLIVILPQRFSNFFQQAQGLLLFGKGIRGPRSEASPLLYL